MILPLMRELMMETGILWLGQGKNSGEIKLYLDGNLYTSSISGTQEFASTTDIRLGNNTLNSRHFDGNIELSVWNRLLNQSEVQDLMFNSLNGNENNLTGYWNFNDGEGLP